MRRFRNGRRRRLALSLTALAATTATLAIVAGTGAAAGNDKRHKAPQLDANRAKVGPGATVRLSGRFSATLKPNAASAEGAAVKRPPAHVRIQFKAAGKDHFHQIAKTGTDKRGRYAKGVKVKRSGHYRAVAADGRISAPQWVRVKSRVHARLAKRDLDLGDKIKVKGRVSPAIGRRPVLIRVGGKRAATKTNKRGRFTARLKARDTGTHKVKVKARGDRVAAASSDKAGKVTVYRPAQASWYGPGLYGNPLACGGRLKPGTVGVANKTLPCGTKLKLRYGHKTVKVKVIDRGPYAGNREFDLTEATKNKLGFPDVGTVYASR